MSTSAAVSSKVTTKKSVKRHSPYDSTARERTADSSTMTSSKQTNYPESAPPLASSSTIQSTPRPNRVHPSVRTICLETIHKRYPYYTPRNDWEILLLSSGPYKGDPSGMHEYIDRVLAHEMTVLRGDMDKLLAQSKKMLDGEADSTGRKPRPGEPDVFVQSIPKSKYSIRLFPGSEKYKEYCLDFVRTDTGEAVNSPFQFDLFCVASLQAPSPTGRIARMRPLECAFGYSEDEIRPGEEKFLLNEGRSYVLRRRGHRDVRFTVPIRQREKPTPPPVDADILQFPQYI